MFVGLSTNAISATPPVRVPFLTLVIALTLSPNESEAFASKTKLFPDINELADEFTKLALALTRVVSALAVKLLTAPFLIYMLTSALSFSLFDEDVPSFISFPVALLKVPLEVAFVADAYA